MMITTNFSATRYSKLYQDLDNPNMNHQNNPFTYSDSSSSMMKTNMLN